MTDQFRPDFQSLEQNIIDVIKEEEIKLGFRKETIRLYYPKESLDNLLNVNLSINELKRVLDGFCDYTEEKFGKLRYSCEDRRFCIVIPEKGVVYVHEQVEDRYFLKEFIDKIGAQDCSIDDILSVFNRYSNQVICEKVTHGEFDYLIYFKDGIPDTYRYCIKFEDCHAIYHRFTIADYDSFGFEKEHKITVDKDTNRVYY